MSFRDPLAVDLFDVVAQSQVVDVEMDIENFDGNLGDCDVVADNDQVVEVVVAVVIADMRRVVTTDLEVDCSMRSLQPTLDDLVEQHRMMVVQDEDALVEVEAEVDDGQTKVKEVVVVAD